MKKGLILGMAVAVAFGATLVVFAADEPRKETVREKIMGKEADLRTLQGTVVDLRNYLIARQEGKEPMDAAKWELKIEAKEGKTEVDIRADRPGGAAAERPMQVFGFLVTEKDWLSKLVPGRELYVVLYDRETASTFKLNEHLGHAVKLSGRVYDHDGVRAITISKLEHVSGAGEMK